MGLHSGHRKRLKADFLAHGEQFHDHQLLELLLSFSIPQKDTNDLAHLLLNQFGSLAGVFNALPASLSNVPGVGEHTTALLKLIPLLSNRYQESQKDPGNIIATTQQAIAYMKPYFGTATRNETMYLLCMDAKHKVIACKQICEGTASSIDFSLRKVMEVALSLNATSVLLAHNHISGLALPSTADLTATTQLVEFLGGVGIELIDHLIFAQDEATSLRNSGLVSGYDNRW